MTVDNYEISFPAYAKLMLHAAKYPSCQVTGLLTGRKGGDSTMIIENCFPLAHTDVLSPMLEVATNLVNTHIVDQSRKDSSGATPAIIGLYTGNASANDKTVSHVCQTVGDTIKMIGHERACILQIDGATLGDPKSIGLKLLLRTGEVGKGKSHKAKSPSGGWDAARADKLRLQGAEGSVTRLNEYLAKRWEAKVVDFDDHFDNIEEDWLNLALDAAF